MCGLCGEVRFDGYPAREGAVRCMTRALERRGPDGGGILAKGAVALGHRRLKVIDLSERGAQPMVDADLGLAVVFNGAIYNYRQLRTELEALGYRFTSATDTEVLLKAYHAWGEDFVQRLDGMFAFALWEQRSGRVVLGRDRLGIKPLYFARIPGGLRFASSLPALIAAGDFDTELDPVALHHYMTLQGTIPAPRTLLASARKLKPGHLLRIEPNGETSERAWWRLRLAEDPDEQATPEEWRERVLGVLRRAVRRRLAAADVPVGVLLSGGLDSSLIVALASEHGARAETFSIGFAGHDDDRGDELPHARRVAERFATEHHELRIAADDLADAIEPAVTAMSEPLVHPDAVGFYLLAREVSKIGRVVLTGQGADELFAGYGSYQALHAAPLGALTYAAVCFNRGHANYRRAVHPRFAEDDHSLRLLRRHFAADHATNDVDRALHFDTAVRLGEDPLKRVDDMTMVWGIEARVPFLAHELVELAARMPVDLKLASGGKHILRQAAHSLLPASIIDREKGYFPVPPLLRLEGRFLDFVSDVLRSDTAQARGLLRPEYVEALFEQSDIRGRSRKLWQAAVLELWLQTHGL